jgi:cytochrome c oxidase subunit I+III
MSSETGFDPKQYDRFPTKGERPEGELEELKRVWKAPQGWGLITAVNNNYVGVWYIGAAFLFFVLAGALAVLMRTQLALPLQGVLPQEVYNQVFTVHGTTMMFLFAVPAVEALGVLLLPQMIAARDLPFPRLSAYAFWAYFVGGLAFFASLFFGLAPDGGWFMYPPLTSKEYSPGINADFWLLGIGFIEISAIAGAIEIVVGVLKTRAPGMSLDKMPIFAWAMLIFAVMIIIGFPGVIAATLLLELERALDWPFFDAARAGDPILWQHLFWFFGHPEVYIIFLPAAGMMSMIIPAVARTPLVGHRIVVLAIIATGFLSFGVWAHHMFATGLPPISLSYFSAASMAVSVPAGLQVFAWIATIAAGRMRFNTPGLFAIGAIVTFTMGGVTGVMLGLVPFDWQTHDTHFVVAHFHYVLIGGMVMPLFAAFYYWTPMTSKRPLSEKLGKWVFWLFFGGMHITFLPMHLTGLMGMPRRVYTYPEGTWEIPNLISTVGTYMIAVGVLIFIIDVIRNFRFTTGDDAGNVYGGGTLEWLPADLYSTRSIPVVRSAYPLWDDKNISEDVKEGRYLLPRTALGDRETIITSPLRAEPQYLQLMPGPSIWHVAAALFTAAFFILLTLQVYWPGLACGLIAVVCVLRWVWETDIPMREASVDIGEGIRIPTYATGAMSHGWWAMVVLLIVAGMVFAMVAFSHIFLWSRSPDLWANSPDWLRAAAPLGANALAALIGYLALRWLRKGASSAVAAIGVAASALLLAVGNLYEFWDWTSFGSEPTADARAATIFAMLALQGFCVFIAVLMAGYVAVRAAAAKITPERRATVEAVWLFLAYTAAQGVAIALVARILPVAGGGA